MGSGQEGKGPVFGQYWLILLLWFLKTILAALSKRAWGCVQAAGSQAREAGHVCWLPSPLSPGIQKGSWLQQPPFTDKKAKAQR